MTESFDSITIEQLRRDGGKKWADRPGMIGAWIAEMDFGIAPEIRDALQQGLDRSLTGYLPTGLGDELRAATAGFVQRRYDWQVDPAQVQLAPDVLNVLRMVMQHLLPEGARVIVPTPAYMPFMVLPQAYGRELVQLPMVQADDGWQMDWQRLDDTMREGDLVVLCNPHNPIGKVYRSDELRQLAEIVERHHGRVFNDEIHAPLTLHGARHTPYPTVSEAALRHTVTAMSCSKAWNLPGLKCAQMIVHPDDERTLAKLAIEREASTPGALACTAAYTAGDAWLGRVIDQLETNQQHLVDLLDRELPGVRFIPNEGTYLAWLDCTALDPGEPPADFFAREAGVSLTDGRSCGGVGEGCVRLNFATPLPVLQQMLHQMGDALRRR